MSKHGLTFEILEKYSSFPKFLMQFKKMHSMKVISFTLFNNIFPVHVSKILLC